MQKVFIAYASAKGLNVNELRFCLDGQRIQPSDTPETLKLEDQDQIDCFLAQDGGWIFYLTYTKSCLPLGLTDEVSLYLYAAVAAESM